jgi:hypothetical protein
VDQPQPSQPPPPLVDLSKVDGLVKDTAKTADELLRKVTPTAKPRATPKPKDEGTDDDEPKHLNDAVGDLLSGGDR